MSVFDSPFRASLLVLLLVVACGDESTWERPGEGQETSEGNAGPTPECHPLFQDCPPGTQCFATGGAAAFECEQGEDAQGGLGEACFGGLECQPGLLCSGLEVVAGCSAGFGCCTFFCEVGVTDCGSGLDCEPYFDGGGPPGFEELGVCQPSGA